MPPTPVSQVPIKAPASSPVVPKVPLKPLVDGVVKPLPVKPVEQLVPVDIPQSVTPKKINSEDSQPQVNQPTNIENNIQTQEDAQILDYENELASSRNLQANFQQAQFKTLALELLENEKDDLARQAINNYIEQYQQIERNYKRLLSSLEDTKAPSKLTYDALLIYAICLDGYEIIAVVLKIIAYIATGGAGALAGEPATILLDLALDIPIFGYMFKINKTSKDYTQKFEAITGFLNTLDQQSGNADALRERLTTLKGSTGFSAVKERGSGTIGKLNQARGRIGKGTRTFPGATKIIDRLKSGPIKKFGKQGLRILGDLIAFVEIYPFRIQTVRGLYRDFKEAHVETIINMKPELTKGFVAYSQDSQVTLLETIEFQKANINAQEQEILK